MDRKHCPQRSVCPDQLSPDCWPLGLIEVPGCPAVLGVLRLSVPQVTKTSQKKNLMTYSFQQSLYGLQILLFQNHCESVLRVPVSPALRHLPPLCAHLSTASS